MRNHDRAGTSGTLFIGVMSLDAQGRVPLGRPARVLSWRPGEAIELAIIENVLRLSGCRTGTEPTGTTVALDRRCRLQLPFGVRCITGLMPGVAALALTTANHGLVVVPMATLVPALGWRDAS